MNYTVSVTQEDIDQGVRNSSFSCAVARACRRVIPYFSSCYNGACIGGKLVPLPKDVFSWILNFDAGNLVKPITFELTIP